MRSYKPQPRLQLQSSFGVHPPVATGIRRRQPFGSSPASAPLLHTRRPAHRQGEAIKPCCGGSSQQTAEARPTKELPHDSARRTVATPPPPGVEANNAVTLRQRQRQRQRQLDDEAAASSAATASAARAPQAVAATAPKAGGDAQQTAVLPAEAEAPDERAEGDVPGSVLGAVALITGSTVGAGILALPSVAAPAGFGPSTAALVGCWALLAAEAMLLAEVNIGVTAIRAQQQPGGLQPAGQQQMVTLRQMADVTLGRVGGTAASAIYLLLSCSLLTAYIAKAGELLSSGSMLDPGIAGASFTAALGGMMCFGGAGTADTVNRWLTGALMLLFGGILAFGAGHADASLLTATVDWRQAPPAVPIIFLALVFHDLVPVVVSQLGCDRRRVRTALLAGSLLPLAMFISWDAIMLALTGEPGADAPADPLAMLIADSGGAVGGALQAFSLLALATSFIGTCTGLTSTLQSEYAAVTALALPASNSSLRSPTSASNRDAEAEPAESAAEDSGTRAAQHPAPQSLVYLAALFPPLALALAHPGSFLTLLSAAGGYGMSMLYAFMPPLMAWQLRYCRPSDDATATDADSQSARTSASRDGIGGASASASSIESIVMPGSTPAWMPGGRGVLAAMCASAVAVQAGQAAMSAGWL